MDETEASEMVELSLNSVVGLITPKTMKMRGRVGPQEVVVLVDCGVTQLYLLYFGSETRDSNGGERGLWGSNGHRYFRCREKGCAKEWGFPWLG